jgi:hypothetical protein
MSIKDDELYPKYLLHLESKNLSKGGFELSKMSKNNFEDFVFRYENNPTFKEKIDNSFRTIDREEKIEDIVNDEFDLFMEEMGEEVKIENKIDNDFFDF